MTVEEAERLDDLLEEQTGCRFGETEKCAHGDCKCNSEHNSEVY